jgi:hypothetical protein
MGALKSKELKGETTPFNSSLIINYDLALS